MANLLPTKGNLIAAKRSRMLAQTGYELMDRKRNILIRELMGMMDTAKELQGQIDAVFTEAYTALQAANIRLGICDRIAEAVDVDDSLTLRYRSVMGVELPRIPGQSPPPRPEYGMGRRKFLWLLHKERRPGGRRIRGRGSYSSGNLQQLQCRCGAPFRREDGGKVPIQRARCRYAAQCR